MMVVESTLSGLRTTGEVGMTIKQHKVVVALPVPLEPDSIYYVRNGSGFDIHVTNNSGVVVGYELNANLNKVDKVAGKGLSDANFTLVEKNKLSSLDSSKFVGLFVNESALPLSGNDGDYANVDGGVGSDVYRVIWDSSDSKWVKMQGVSTDLTPAQIKQQYESNPDTNAFTDDEKVKLASVANGATANRGDSENADREHTHTVDQVAGLGEALDNKVDTSNIAQTTGQSTTHLMSQAAITEAIANIPSVPKSAAYTVTAADKGASIDTSAGVTIPATLFAVGDVIVVTNTSASSISITPAAGVTFRLAGSASTGLRTLAGYGVATFRMASSNVWFASGAGLS